MEERKPYSGKFIVRVPAFVHEKLAKAADDQGVSLNAFVQAVLVESTTRLSTEKRMRRLQAKAEVQK